MSNELNTKDPVADVVSALKCENQSKISEEIVSLGADKLIGDGVVSESDRDSIRATLAEVAVEVLILRKQE